MLPFYGSRCVFAFAVVPWNTEGPYRLDLWDVTAIPNDSVATTECRESRTYHVLLPFYPYPAFMHSISSERNTALVLYQPTLFESVHPYAMQADTRRYASQEPYANPPVRKLHGG